MNNLNNEIRDNSLKWIRVYTDWSIIGIISIFTIVKMSNMFININVTHTTELDIGPGIFVECKMETNLLLYSLID